MAVNVDGQHALTADGDLAAFTRRDCLRGSQCRFNKIAVHEKDSRRCARETIQKFSATVHRSSYAFANQHGNDRMSL